MERKGVPLVIAEHRPGRSRLEHVAHQTEGLADLRSAVEEVPDEDRRALRMPPDAGAPRVAHPAQQLLELGRVAVDVADEVVHAGAL